MKKLFSVLAVLFVLGTTSTFAIGIGAQGTFNAGSSVTYGGALSLKLDNLPPVFAIRISPFGNGIYLGGTADWWVANPTISGPFGFYYAPGLAVGVGLDDDAAQLIVGGRLVAGVNVFIAKAFELYLQAAWQPTVGFWLSNNNSAPIWDMINFPVDIGFRFWF